MRHMMKMAACIGLALAILPAKAQDLAAEGDRWWNHVRVLADSGMEGRLTGSEGYLRAAKYVTEQFAAVGLKPAGQQDWFQWISYETQKILMEQSSLTLDTGPVQIDEEAYFNNRLPQPESIEAELVFVGYGISLPEAGYDDFAGLDLKGKIAVAANGGPDTISGALKSHAHSQELWKALARSGAVGLITIGNPKYTDIPWARSKMLARNVGMYLTDPHLRNFPGTLFTASVNPEKAEKFFAKSGHDWKEILQLAETDKPLPRFPMKQKLHARISRQMGHVKSPNVVGRWDGSDPKLKDEVIVVSAHLDHQGVGEPINGDPVYHGAMDNASGIASLIETARLLHDKGAKPKRSIIFLAVSGEERGLLGSRAYVAAPTGLKQGQIVADINMDMYLPLWPLKALLALGADQSGLGAIAEKAVRDAGFQLVPDPQPNRNLFVRSDQYSFIRNGIPALSLKFAATSDEERTIGKNWLTNYYHSPADNLDQPVDRQAAAAFDHVLSSIVLAAADAPTRPSWLPDSFFKRFEKHPM